MAKQNLFLFYEDHDFERLIGNSMVRLYMNRFVIDEEKGVEIIGVETLSKPVYPPHCIPGGLNESHILYEADFDELRLLERNKLNKDASIIQKAFEKSHSYVGEKSHIHFVIGSQFYMKRLTHYRMQFFMDNAVNAVLYGELGPLEKMIWFMMHRVSRLKISNSFSCSFLTGAVITLRPVFKLTTDYNEAVSTESPSCELKFKTL